MKSDVKYGIVGFCIRFFMSKDEKRVNIQQESIEKSHIQRVESHTS